MLYVLLNGSKPSKLLNVQSLSIFHMTTVFHLFATKFRICKNGVPGRHMCIGGVSGVSIIFKMFQVAVQVQH